MGACVRLNGKGENAHEDFCLREHFSQNFEPHNSGFCKTARNPYDAVIVAALCILKHRLGDAVQVYSDGRYENWQYGVELARRVLKLKSIKNPIEKEEEYENAS